MKKIGQTLFGNFPARGQVAVGEQVVLVVLPADWCWKCQQQRDDPVALTLQTLESMVSSNPLLLLLLLLVILVRQGKQATPLLLPVCLQIPTRCNAISRKSWGKV